MKEKKHKDTQEMAGRTDNPSEKEKKKRINWKRFRRRLAAFLIVAAIGTGYWYYAWEYRAETEPETELTETNTDPVYTMERYLRTLKRNSTVYEYACDEDEADEEYGTYVVPGLKATRTIQYKKEGTPHVCTSMTPQGLAITEDYVLISAYCRTKEHNSVIYVIDKKTHEYVK